MDHFHFFKVPTTTTTTTMSDLQCKYAYKECPNMRTYKRDGELHRLCEYHRNKANALQKIYATKRRRELRQQKRLAFETNKLDVAKLEPIPFSEAHEWTFDLVDLECLLLDDLDIIDDPSSDPDDQLSEEELKQAL
ncbi:hypothetical protein AC1031_010694 [Aphanomyces cochlioides]|nr:hypothetical protein AC1031_010694 [Aphanomyces cochlioides]